MSLVEVSAVLLFCPIRSAFYRTEIHTLYLFQMGKTKSHVRKAQTARAASVVNLQELIETQGVQPATDLDAIGALWPAEDDPAAFLEFLDAERTARRQKAQKR